MDTPMWRNGGSLQRNKAVIFVVAALLIGSGVGLGGCSSSSKSARPRARASVPTMVIRDTPAILRGTIGAETTLRGDQPLMVSGYGIVVGLDGTGSSDVPAAVRVLMEKEMTRRGVGQETSGMGWTTPARMINDENTAVVFVQAVLPAGARKGSIFDVVVSAIPGSSTTSLEGGRLWSTDLRPGIAVPGGPDRQQIAEASGDLFLNPFADPEEGTSGTDGINRRSGRILGGGVSTNDRSLSLVLDNPSHARARSMVSAINSRFPQGRGDRRQTATGENEELIEIWPPSRFSNDTEEFLELLRASRNDVGGVDEWARRYSLTLKAQPELAEELSWRLQALGPRSKPFLRPLYDDAELAPRMAALRAGARLGDALVTPHLKQVALSEGGSARLAAIELLGDMGPDPRVNLALRELVDAEALDVRIAAYEALATRNDPSIRRHVIEDKFLLDTIPSERGMIYVSQQGMPRIVLFGGAETELKRPTLVSAWSDRLMLTADSADDPIRVYYLDHRTGRSVTESTDARLDRFVRFMAHKPTPESPGAGLGLTYSQVVGGLYAIWKDGGIEAGFVAEQDKLAAELIRSLDPVSAQERPETIDEGLENVDVPGERPTAPGPAEAEKRKPTYVVPIPGREEPK